MHNIADANAIDRADSRVIVGDSIFSQKRFGDDSSLAWIIERCPSTIGRSKEGDCRCLECRSDVSRPRVIGDEQCRPLHHPFQRSKSHTAATEIDRIAVFRDFCAQFTL